MFKRAIYVVIVCLMTLALAEYKHDLYPSTSYTTHLLFSLWISYMVFIIFWLAIFYVKGEDL